MICPKCGKEVTEGAKFCPECGALMDSVNKDEKNAQNSSEQGNSQSSVSMEKEQTENSSKKKLPGKLIAALIAAAAAVVAIVILVITHRPVVNMADYLTVSFEGYNTVGRASESFDYDAFSKKYSGKLKFNKKYMVSALQELEGFDEEEAEEDVEYAMSQYEDLSVELISDIVANSGSFDKSSELSNGDVITYSWDAAGSPEELDKFGKALGCKIKCDPVEFTVTGLEEIKTTDPFKNVSVTFSGVSPDGTAKVTNEATDEMGRSLNFVADKISELSNGDKITVSISGYNGDEYYAENYGTIISPVKKEYTVEGLPHYITSIDEIPADTLEKMKKQADDNFDAYHAKNYSNNEILKGREFIGTYVLSQKESSKDNWTGGFNCAVYLCYRIDVEDYYEDNNVLYDQVNTYYSLCRFDDITVADDGTVDVDLSNYSSPESDSYSYTSCEFGNGYYYLNGYSSLDAMYKDVVQKQTDRYEVENKVEDIETDYKATYCETIPDAAKEYNGHYYLCVNAGTVDWESAEKRCEEKKGHLVTITSEDEMSWILRNLDVATYNEYWIGCDMDQNGNWQWTTGEKFEYTNWADFNPRDTDGKLYYVKTTQDGKWCNAANNSTSWYLRGYVIEWDGPITDDASAAGSSSSETEAAEN